MPAYGCRWIPCFSGFPPGGFRPGLAPLRHVVGGLALAMSAAAWAAETESAMIDQVRQRFALYQSLERQFDPALAELYLDQGDIWVVRRYRNGVVRQLKIPAKLYKKALTQSMEQAAAKGDFNQYQDEHFRTQGQDVHVTALRSNLWRNYSSPYSAVWVKKDGNWHIREERFETQVPHDASE